MKNDREFSGTLLGFDDFVSSSFSPHLIAPRIVTSRVALMNVFVPSRYGLGGRNRVVRSIRSPATPPQISSLSLPPLTFASRRYSETTPQGKKTTKLNQTLLNGNNICMVSALPFVLTTDLANNPFPSLYQEVAGQASDPARVHRSTHPWNSTQRAPARKFGLEGVGKLCKAERFGYQISHIVGRHYIMKMQPTDA